MYEVGEKKKGKGYPDFDRRHDRHTEKMAVQCT